MGDRIVMLAAAAALALALATCGASPMDAVLAAERLAPQDVTNPDAEAVAEFMDRVTAYVAIHQKFEREAPTPDDATPQQIDRTQRALAAKIQADRVGARRGDIFTPEMTAFVKRLLTRVFAAPDGRRLRSSIMDENVKFIALKVNQRYPDAIPLTSMPPKVLEALPELPEEMEYRFVGDQLILLDPHAHLIPDFIPAALPGK
jgi:hypothetical protein